MTCGSHVSFLLRSQYSSNSCDAASWWAADVRLNSKLLEASSNSEPAIVKNKATSEWCRSIQLKSHLSIISCNHWAVEAERTQSRHFHTESLPSILEQTRLLLFHGPQYLLVDSKPCLNFSNYTPYSQRVLAPVRWRLQWPHSSPQRIFLPFFLPIGTRVVLKIDFIQPNVGMCLVDVYIWPGHQRCHQWGGIQVLLWNSCSQPEVCVSNSLDKPGSETSSWSLLILNFVQTGCCRYKNEIHGCLMLGDKYLIGGVWQKPALLSFSLPTLQPE